MKGCQKEEHGCLKVCEANKGFDGSSSNTTMIKSEIFSLNQSEKNISQTYKEQKQKPKGKASFSVHQIVKNISNYTDFQALFSKITPKHTRN